eukprot:scaffold1374_cov175-Amphora_coffeaeformis.AAC.11
MDREDARIVPKLGQYPLAARQQAASNSNPPKQSRRVIPTAGEASFMTRARAQFKNTPLPVTNLVHRQIITLAVD